MQTKIPVMNIIQDSIVDGEGLRAVVFVAGCPHQCQGCHNPQSWKAKNGTLLTLQEICDSLLSNPLNDVTFSGGEPFLYPEQLAKVAKVVKAQGKDIWCWTGFTIEQIKGDPKKIELLKYIDVLIDGKFILEQRDLSLYWKGSKNQRVMKLVDGEVVEIFDDKINDWSGVL